MISELVEALNLLTLAYRSAGLLWAARANCLMAAARIVSFAEEESELRLRYDSGHQTLGMVIGRVRPSS